MIFNWIFLRKLLHRAWEHFFQESDHWILSENESSENKLVFCQFFLKVNSYEFIHVEKTFSAIDKVLKSRSVLTSQLKFYHWSTKWKNNKVIGKGQFHGAQENYIWANFLWRNSLSGACEAFWGEFNWNFHLLIL